MVFHYQITIMSSVNSFLSWYHEDIFTYYIVHFIQGYIFQALKERAAECNNTHLLRGNQCETLLSSALLKSCRRIIMYFSFKCLTRGSLILFASPYIYWETRGRFSFYIWNEWRSRTRWGSVSPSSGYFEHQTLLSLHSCVSICEKTGTSLLQYLV